MYFFHSKIIVTFILVFENSQNSFSCGPSFGPFWSVEYLNLEQNLPIWTVHHFFLESKHPEITKNPYYVLFLEGSQKKVSVPGLYGIIKLYVILIYALFECGHCFFQYEFM